MKRQDVIVSVIARSDRKNLSYRWSDRAAGTKGEETAGTADRRKADRGVAAFIEEVRSRRRSPGIPWQEFRSRYEHEHTAGLRAKSARAWQTAANRYEVAVSPQTLADLSAGGVSQFRAYFRGLIEPTSVDSYLRSLRAAANWAAEIFPGYVPPKFRIGKAKGKGRPLLGEEWDRMLAACEKVVGKLYAPSWRFLLQGIVDTGLRLGQALILSRDLDAPVRIEGIELRVPTLVITADAHKGKRHQVLPLTPPAVALFRGVSPERQEGLVFRPLLSRGPCRSVETASKMICLIGKEAGIRTGERLKRDKGTITKVPRFASAHDLKRTFIQRLLQIGLSPPEVALFAQHQSFETTWQHYTERDAMRLGERLASLYAADQNKQAGASHGDIRGDTPEWVQESRET